MSLRYSSLLMQRLQGAVHCLMLASKQGRNHRQRSSPSSMSRLQVRKRKMRCRTWIAPRSAPAFAKGPNRRTPLSRGLRVISESWNAAKDQLTLSVSGRAGDHYELEVWNPTQVLRVEGATLGNSAKLQIQMPQGTPESYTAQTVTLHFAP